jgi:hypothetical protein
VTANAVRLTGENSPSSINVCNIRIVAGTNTLT